MVSVTFSSLTRHSLSQAARDINADTQSSRPCHSPRREGGVICFDHLNDE